MQETATSLAFDETELNFILSLAPTDMMPSSAVEDWLSLSLRL